MRENCYNAANLHYIIHPYHLPTPLPRAGNQTPTISPATSSNVLFGSKSNAPSHDCNSFNRDNSLFSHSRFTTSQYSFVMPDVPIDFT